MRIFDNQRSKFYTTFMQKYIEKMKVELLELESRIKKCEKAIENPPFGADEKGLELIKVQVQAMKNYRECLKSRIEYEVTK